MTFPKSLSLEKAPRLGLEPKFGHSHASHHQMGGIAEKGAVGAGGFAMGMMLGALIGAAAGMLMAPKAGSESRAMLQDKASEVLDLAKEKSKGLMEQSRGIMDKSMGLVDKAKSLVVQAGGGSQFEHHGELSATEQQPEEQPQEALQGQYGTA